MTPGAIALVLGSAALHATWNALTRRARAPFLFLWSAMVVATIAFAPLALAIDPTGLGAAIVPLVGSGIVHALYFVALSSAYRHGDLSVVYPIARGTGVALVPVIAALALGESIALLGAIGIAVVVAGIGVTGSSAPRQGEVARAAIARAAITGVLIAIYSVLDRTGARAMHPLPFVVGTNLIACALSAPLALRHRDELRAEWRANGRTIVLASGMTLGGYLLVLFAFRMAPTAYVSASREISIAIAAAIGMTVLGEPRSRSRIAGAFLVVLGVVLVALAG